MLSLVLSIKTEDIFNHKISIPNMVPNMPVLMVIIPMVVISMFSFAKKENNNLGNLHRQGDYYTYHLFCLFLQFCEAVKQLAKSAFVQNVQFSHIF